MANDQVLDKINVKKSVYGDFLGIVKIRCISDEKKWSSTNQLVDRAKKAKFSYINKIRKVEKDEAFTEALTLYNEKYIKDPSAYKAKDYNVSIAIDQALDLYIEKYRAEIE